MVGPQQLPKGERSHPQAASAEEVSAGLDGGIG
jgi:hypothetical protein